MIDKLTEDLRQVYETTENEFNLQVQKAIKNNWTKKKLKEELLKANKRCLRYVKGIRPSLIDTTIKINERLYKSALKQYTSGLLKVKRLSKSEDLKESIEKVTKEGIENGLKINAGGRTWSYKTYMEMNARTTIQHEIGDRQLESGKGNVIFYICDFFADCADDHKDFQGKVYYDERWESWGVNNPELIKAKIKEQKMLSFQHVRDNEPYLTTRPNCRTRLNTISITAVMNKSPKTILKEKQLTRGSYKPKNYKATQEQRYNERMIRKYKERSSMNEELGNKEQVIESKRLVSKWQRIQRDHLKANPNLQRDYRRESNKILINDLGAKYNS